MNSECIKTLKVYKLFITPIDDSGDNMISRNLSVESDMVERNDEQPIRFTMGSKMPSQLSLASDMASIYEKYSMHIDVIKWTAVVVILALMSTSVAVTSGMSRRLPKNNTDCKKITIDYGSSGVVINKTTCGYLKQFDLPGYYKVTVCSFQKQVWIDIGHFKDFKQNNGVLLNAKQWRYIQRLRTTINDAVKRAGKELRQ